MADSVIIIFGKNTRPFHTWAAKWQTEIWYACETRILTAVGQGAGGGAVARAGVWGILIPESRWPSAPVFHTASTTENGPAYDTHVDPTILRPDQNVRGQDLKRTFPSPRKRRRKSEERKETSLRYRRTGVQRQAETAVWRPQETVVGKGRTRLPGKRKARLVSPYKGCRMLFGLYFRWFIRAKSYITFWKQFYHQY